MRTKLPTEAPVLAGNGRTREGHYAVSVPEAGAALRLSRDLAYAAAASGELPTIRVGRRLLVPVVALERLLGLAAEADEK